MITHTASRRSLSSHLSFVSPAFFLACSCTVLTAAMNVGVFVCN